MLNQNRLDPVVYLNSNDGTSIVAFGEGPKVKLNVGNALNQLTDFLETHKGNYCFGYLSFDLKNEIEDLESNNRDYIGFPDLFFFRPKWVVKINQKDINYVQGTPTRESDAFVSQYVNPNQKSSNNTIRLEPLQSKEEYLKTIEALKNHLQRGDIYEVTYCQGFLAEQVTLDPLATYFKLNAKTIAPFSCFVSLGNRYLMSGSPERFLKREGDKLISQPIKGTARRSSNPEEDQQNKENLLKSEKERAENVMIVDLVRNDLSRVAAMNSVSVEELFGVYSFKTVHQLISTISAKQKPNTTFKELMHALFPMGSMTGAPKISALQLIEQHETFKRGLFSGAVGYVAPNGDFDFNVIIRSILYNASTKTVLCPVGGAITIQSDAQEEYNECLLKAAAMMQILDEK